MKKNVIDGIIIATHKAQPTIIEDLVVTKNQAKIEQSEMFPKVSLREAAENLAADQIDELEQAGFNVIFIKNSDLDKIVKYIEAKKG